MDEETKLRIESVFIERMQNFGVKWKSKTFYTLQCEFFVGAMAALQEEPPHWCICLMSQREIVKY